MNHLVLILLGILSIEIFLRFGFLLYLDSILKVTKKVTHTLLNKQISDHWKEKVIPVYALKIMKFSLKILLILLCIISLFLIADILITGFLKFTISLNGVIESMVFAFLYIYVRRSFAKNE